jgi:hypothetical protein
MTCERWGAFTNEHKPRRVIAAFGSDADAGVDSTSWRQRGAINDGSIGRGREAVVRGAIDRSRGVGHQFPQAFGVAIPPGTRLRRASEDRGCEGAP